MSSFSTCDICRKFDELHTKKQHYLIQNSSIARMESKLLVSLDADLLSGLPLWSFRVLLKDWSNVLKIG